MSFNGGRTPSSSSSGASSWAAQLAQLKKLIPKSNTNDSRGYNKLQDDNRLSLRDEFTNSHSLERPSTDDAKNESNAANRVRRRRLDEGRHENVSRPNSNNV